MSGYTISEASSMDAALSIAKACPFLENGGHTMLCFLCPVTREALYIQELLSSLVVLKKK